MSGGPYGRGKAPERACLPIDQWPEADRRLWLGRLRHGRHSRRRGRRPVRPRPHQQHQGRQRLWAMANLSRAIDSPGARLSAGDADYARAGARLCRQSDRDRQQHPHDPGSIAGAWRGRQGDRPQSRLVLHQRPGIKSSRPPSARARQDQFPSLERAGRPRDQTDASRRGSRRARRRDRPSRWAPDCVPRADSAAAAQPRRSRP